MTTDPRVVAAITGWQRTVDAAHATVTNTAGWLGFEPDGFKPVNVNPAGVKPGGFKRDGFKPNGGGFTNNFGGKSGGVNDRKKDKDGKDAGGWQKTEGGGRSYQKERESKSSGLFANTLKPGSVPLPLTKTATAAAKVEVAGTHVSGGFKGLVHGDGTANVSAIGAGAQAYAGVDALAANAGANADAHLLEADAKGQLNLGDHVNASGSASGEIGAHTGVDGTVGPLGAQVSGDAFVGSEVKGNIGAEVGGVTAGAHAGASAGVGANAGADFGMGADHKIHFGGSVGLTLGVGFNVGFDVSVDPAEMANTMTDVAKDGGHLISSAAHGFGLW